MKNQLNTWKAYFKLSQKEAVGTFLLGIGLFGLTALLSISDYLFRGDPFELTPEDSAQVAQWLREAPTTSREFSPSFTAKDYTGPRIDPNRASVETLTEIGLPKYLAERLVKYRSKGGQFRQEKDIAKLYGITPEILTQIRPHLQFSGIPTGQDKFPKSSYPNAFPKQNKPKAPTRFDINTADTTVWKSLPGIGSGYAKRICNFREKLGGFLSVEQVLETYQLPPELGPTIRNYGFVGAPARKIRINQVEEIKHPYLPYAQAKAILAYRAQHGPFKTLDDLKAIKRLTPEVIEKIAPYLSFDM